MPDRPLTARCRACVTLSRARIGGVSNRERIRHPIFDQLLFRQFSSRIFPFSFRERKKKKSSDPFCETQCIRRIPKVIHSSVEIDRANFFFFLFFFSCTSRSRYITYIRVNEIPWKIFRTNLFVPEEWKNRILAIKKRIDFVGNDFSRSNEEDTGERRKGEGKR